MRRASLLILVLIFEFFIHTNLGAKLPNLRLIDPYFSKPNQSFTGISWNLINLGAASIQVVALDVDYGVNERLMVSLFAPYLFVPGSPGAGILGDLGAGLKAVLFQSESLTWRLILDIFVRFPTGVKESDGLINVAGVVFKYYPFSVGTGMFSPSLTFSYLLQNWMFWTTVSYQSENNEQDTLIAFQADYDRLDFQLSADYFFKIPLSSKENDFFILRPAAILEYKQNLSSLIRIPTGIYGSVELNWKWASILKGKIGINVPIYTLSSLHNFQLYIQLGKNF